MGQAGMRQSCLDQDAALGAIHFAQTLKSWAFGAWLLLSLSVRLAETALLYTTVAATGTGLLRT